MKTRNVQTIGVIGCGAMGLFYGMKLQQNSDLKVKFLLRSDYEVVKEKGVRISSCDQDLKGFVDATNNALDLKNCDLLLICLKTTANSYLSEILPEIVNDKTIIMTIQNGLGNEEFISQFISRDRIIGGVAFVCLNRNAPGSVLHTAYGHIKANGYTQNFDLDILKEVQELFVAVNLDFIITNSILKIKWEKLIWNVPFNGISALLNGLDTMEIVTYEPLKKYAEDIMKEVIKAACAINIELDESLIQKNLDYTLSMGPYKTSMYLDRINNRLVEVESIIGEPLRQGEKSGVELPLMRSLYCQLSYYNYLVNQNN